MVAGRSDGSDVGRCVVVERHDLGEEPVRPRPKFNEACRMHESCVGQAGETATEALLTGLAGGICWVRHGRLSAGVIDTGVRAR